MSTSSWGTTWTEMEGLADPGSEFRELHAELVRILDEIDPVQLERALIRVPGFRDRALVLERAARALHADTETARDALLERMRRSVRERLKELGFSRPGEKQVEATLREMFGGTDQYRAVVEEELGARVLVQRCRALSDAWANREHGIRILLRR